MRSLQRIISESLASARDIRPYRNQQYFYDLIDQQSRKLSASNAHLTHSNLDVFLSSGVSIPIYILPHASQFQGVPACSADLVSLLARLPELTGRYLFYSTGAWSYRKGNDLLVRAFRKAFGSRNDVALILKTTPESQDAPPSAWRHALSRVVGAESSRRRAKRFLPA